LRGPSVYRLAGSIS